MKLKYNTESYEVKQIIKKDKKLAKIIKQINDVELILDTDGFRCLVNNIIGQQISDKVRESIFQKLQKKCTITVKNILKLNKEEFKECGISERKANYIQNLAEEIDKGKLDLEKLKKLSNDEVINNLTKIKGIGRWTAEMYLIFTLGRLNVVSKKDATTIRTINWLYKKQLTDEEIDKFFNKFKGYETIILMYFWKINKLKLTKKDFKEL